ncbi:hypothetical protein Micbo1qcDRAFT_169434 [Microdochium bolleyi]|uniref:NAD(P)-binding domain-containing protein n=1 Tax=Microdochium bolleyi TaxID=196109 RepID=A0A136ILD3_9PEZI|nr:hypothetical protein Micbo1qcDRAFT_169434 [Microdochium bolleyi]
MPTYAVLGATGNNGRHVLQALAQRDDVHIRPFVRSRSKLEQQSPEITNQTPQRCTVFTGNITDIDTLASCLRGTDAAFLTVAAFAPHPGCRIARDQAESVVAALRQIREEDGPDARLPMLIVLSSSETDSRLDDGVPWLISSILFRANNSIYTDLIAAETYLRQHADELGVDAVFYKPGGISHDVAHGHALSTERAMTFISYPDVAAGMVQIADDGGERWGGKSVSVVSRKKAKTAWENLPMLGKGLVVYFFPGLYRWLF